MENLIIYALIAFCLVLVIPKKKEKTLEQTFRENLTMNYWGF